MASSTTYTRASRSHPCPVCEKTSWCAIGKNERTGEQFIKCQRVKSDKAFTDKNGAPYWIHPLGDDIKYKEWVESASKREVKKKTVVELTAIAKQFYLGKGADEGRNKLAEAIHSSVESLELLRVGYGYLGQCGYGWTFPERDDAGKVTGISFRLTSGEKRSEPGSTRGLTYAIDNLRSADGPMMIVEGGTDTAAMISIGLPAIGRPSNLGGSKLICKLLGRLQWNRGVIVLGEDDRKTPAAASAVWEGHDPSCLGCNLCWPGMFGAKHAAADIKREFPGLPIAVRVPPDGAKDFRVWYATVHESLYARPQVFLKHIRIDDAAMLPQ